MCMFCNLSTFFYPIEFVQDSRLDFSGRLYFSETKVIQQMDSVLDEHGVMSKYFLLHRFEVLKPNLAY